jgi:hypothetical protein
MPPPQTFFGHLHQAPHPLRRLSDKEGFGRIAVVAIQNWGDIDVDDVAFSQDLLGAGNAVADHVVDAGADGFGKAMVA